MLTIERTWPFPWFGFVAGASSPRIRTTRPGITTGARGPVTAVDVNREAVLISRIRAGDRDLIGELIRIHADRIFRVVKRLVPPAIAEDLLQETWERVVKRFHRYDPAQPFVPWVMAIAVNCCRDYQRRARIRRWFGQTDSGDEPEFPGDMTGDDQELAAAVSDARLDLSAALKRISPPLREVVVLKYYSGCTQAEIAAIVGLPQGTVKSRLHQALIRLRQELDDAREDRSS